MPIIIIIIIVIIIMRMAGCQTGVSGAIEEGRNVTIQPTC